MLTTVIVTLVAILAFSAALALGQFFGREPITPKCNPDACCMRGDDCDSRAPAHPGGH